MKNSLTWIEGHPFRELEFDFVLADEGRYLGYLSTAGFGPVPRFILRNPEAAEAVRESLAASAPSCDAALVGNEAHAVERLDLARRGFLAFD